MIILLEISDFFFLIKGPKSIVFVGRISVIQVARATVCTVAVVQKSCP